MSSDIKLDAQDDGWVTIETNVLQSNSSDFILDNSARRQSAGGFRRALVHVPRDSVASSGLLQRVRCAAGRVAVW